MCQLRVRRSPRLFRTEGSWFSAGDPRIHEFKSTPSGSPGGPPVLTTRCLSLRLKRAVAACVTGEFDTLCGSRGARMPSWRGSLELDALLIYTQQVDRSTNYSRLSPIPILECMCTGPRRSTLRRTYSDFKVVLNKSSYARRSEGMNVSVKNHNRHAIVPSPRNSPIRLGPEQTAIHLISSDCVLTSLPSPSDVRFSSSRLRFAVAAAQDVDVS
ncbi:hypothetical protein C8Q80DRAFT_204618 [Daedaleopsis nitida]|nr:hypothetical protein C8Q80DRAFT_204618 [Daedaleopsis nitida]